MKKILELIRNFWLDKNKVLLLLILIFLVPFSIYILHPQIAGDSTLYVDSIQVLKTGIQPAGFIPMMIVSTYLGLKLIMLFNFFTGSIAISWLALNGVLYVSMGLFFYSLLKRIVDNERVAFLGTIFLATNYAALSFGLAYMMDIGGWAFYVASLYFCYRYLQSESRDENKWLYIASIIVGIGGLYKEYAFVACIVIAGVIIFKNWNKWLEIFLKGFITGCMALIPILLMNVYAFYNYHYTYINWFLYNQHAYAYQNRIVEFIKSFGSIYNFGWFLFIGGLYILLKQTKEIFVIRKLDKNIIFIWLVILSSFTVLLWPVVTRVLFITMPAAIIVSCLFIKKISSKYWIILPILVLYILSAYLMDSFILNFVNLPF